MSAWLSPRQPTCWDIVGGEDRGGLIVRVAEDLASAKCEDRLSTGALVQGWISTLDVSGKVLAVRWLLCTSDVLETRVCTWSQDLPAHLNGFRHWAS